jgi:hypothetical protein
VVFPTVDLPVVFSIFWGCGETQRGGRAIVP